MKKEHRKEERFYEFGRVEAGQISVLPGVLDDISETGCKVHFTNPVDVDMENDYTLLIRLARGNCGRGLNLLGHPCWVKSDGSKTDIGFSFLRSPDTPELINCINCFKSDSGSDETIAGMFESSGSGFVYAL
ncbi:PilZ domain-containing protein [Treponema peruense]|uniref:PilZ domain-containing protein n=1 Tax=Treponema peruense TaxID=2787628 RepID=A0A7T3RC58_9SPIR|nr:PilZ domain-containing protein [Treponema peruense]QQA00439.1 PilZ domain-containing protein [Treponema peruense]